jgi:catechol 2,3-dioxygenase-like lactoylglutathione lyase family enzyme
VRFSQARLLVDDFAEAFRFYRDELGLDASFGHETSGYASFSTPGGTIAIFERGDQAEVVALRPPGDSTLTVLEVDDVDAAAERLHHHLAHSPQDQPGWGGRVAYVRDPSGNLLELFQELPRPG